MSLYKKVWEVRCERWALRAEAATAITRLAPAITLPAAPRWECQIYYLVYKRCASRSEDMHSHTPPRKGLNHNMFAGEAAPNWLQERLLAISTPLSTA